MNDFTTPIVQALIVAAILGLCAWAWAKRETLKTWFAANEEKAAKAKKLAAVADVEDLRRQVVKVAKMLGKVEVETATGTRPMVATYTNGAARVLHRSPGVQGRHENRSGRRARHTHHLRQLPLPIARWSRERCEQWLADHPI